MSNVNDRINDLAVESAQTALDSAHFIQRQNAAFVQSWFSTVQSNQQTGRELVGRSIKQVQEAQQLWLQLIRESFRTTTETFSGFAGSQLREVGEQIDHATKGSNNASKKAETASK
jgi:hypothetical protein